MLTSTEGYSYYVKRMAERGLIPIHRSNFNLKVRSGIIKGAKKSKNKKGTWLVPQGAIDTFLKDHKGGELSSGKPKGRPRKDGSVPHQRSLEERLTPEQRAQRARARARTRTQPAPVQESSQPFRSGIDGRILAEVIADKRPDTTLRDLVHYMDNSELGQRLADTRLRDLIS